jgi:hypothetical protein
MTTPGTTRMTARIHSGSYSFGTPKVTSASDVSSLYLIFFTEKGSFSVCGPEMFSVCQA